MNPLTVYAEFMEHPTYPLQKEQSAQVHECLMRMGSMSDVFAILARFNRYRDAEFPGWHAQYSAEIKLWLQAQGVSVDALDGGRI